MQTARVASMLTGVPLLMLPRAVTHLLGESPEKLLLDNATARLYEAEISLMQRTLKARTKGIIALGPTTLEDPACAAWVAKYGVVIYLRQSLRDATEAIHAEVRKDQAKHRHLMAFGDMEEETLAAVYTDRHAVFEKMANQIIDIEKRLPLRVGRDLVTALGWDADEEAQV